MDTEKLIKEAKARFKHQESKLYLEEKYKNRLIFASQGGSWTADQNLISFLNNFTGTIIIVDNYGNPVKVNATELLTQARALYQQVHEEWYNEYTELNKLR